jgi:hypothetical protein
MLDIRQRRREYVAQINAFRYRVRSVEAMSQALLRVAHPPRRLLSGASAPCFQGTQDG